MELAQRSPGRTDPSDNGSRKANTNHLPLAADAPARHCVAGWMQ